MKLSILIPTVRSRIDRTLPLLLDEIERQARGLPVEVLALYDNKVHSVGVKRNKLVQAATGLYLAFVDDDDWVDPDYVSLILEHVDVRPAPEVIVFDSILIVDGVFSKRCVYGVEFAAEETADLWKGKPAHTHAWAEWVCRKHSYPNLTVGEDRKWSMAACREVRVQARIPEILYHYRRSTTQSETRPVEGSDSR